MASALVHCRSRLVLSRLLPSLRHSPNLCTVTSMKKTKEEEEGEKEEGQDQKIPAYGNKQRKTGAAADSAHSEWENTGSKSAHEESLEETGYDISKRTKPAGEE